MFICWVSENLYADCNLSINSAENDFKKQYGNMTLPNRLNIYTVLHNPALKFRNKHIEVIYFPTE